MKTNPITAIVLLAALTLSGCASYKGGAMQTRFADAFPNAQQAAGVSVGAEAVATEAKAKELFYVNVTEKGYFPIEVAIHNTTPHRVLVQKSMLELTSANGTAVRPINVTAMIDEFERNKMAYALLGFGIFSYMSAEDANKKMAADWTSKELPGEILVNPGRHVSGFVYAKLPAGTKPNGMTLNVTIENLETKATEVVKVTL